VESPNVDLLATDEVNAPLSLSGASPAIHCETAFGWPDGVHPGQAWSFEGYAALLTPTRSPATRASTGRPKKWPWALVAANRLQEPRLRRLAH